MESFGTFRPESNEGDIRDVFFFCRSGQCIKTSSKNPDFDTNICFEYMRTRYERWTHNEEQQFTGVDTFRFALGERLEMRTTKKRSRAAGRVLSTKLRAGISTFLNQYPIAVVGELVALWIPRCVALQCRESRYKYSSCVSGARGATVYLVSNNLIERESSRHERECRAPLKVMGSAAVSRSR